MKILSFKWIIYLKYTRLGLYFNYINALIGVSYLQNIYSEHAQFIKTSFLTDTNVYKNQEPELFHSDKTVLFTS